MNSSEIDAEKTDAVLREVVQLFTQLRKSTMSCCTDATSKESEALMLIGRAEGLTVQGFAEQMGLEKTWASRLLVRMERAKLIKRVPNPGDSRSLLIQLTGRGRSEQRRLAEGLKEHAGSLLACVPPAERMNVQRALVHLRDALVECLVKCGRSQCLP